MNEIPLSTWKDFENAIEEREQKLKEICKRQGREIQRPLFRGQSNSKWNLETTLERFLGTDMPLIKYYRAIHLIKTNIETATYKSLDIPSPEKYEAWLSEGEWNVYSGKFAAHEYFAYLRHHGFPSPLLDWTASPYVATFLLFVKSLKMLNMHLFFFM